MDFPNKAFPYQLYERVSRKTPDGYTHTSMREPFSSYGTHGNIDVEDISEKRFYPQKIPEGFVQSTNTWKPSRPTLPLYSSPELVSYPFIDVVTDPLEEERFEIRKLLDNLKCHRSLAKNKTFEGREKKHKNRFFKEMKEELDKIEDVYSADAQHDAYKIKKDLPKSYRYLVDLYDKYKLTKEIMRVNSSYTGGCLGYIPCQNHESSFCASVVAPCENFTKLKISHVKCDDQENICVDRTQSVECKEKTHGVTASRIRGKGFVAARHTSMCTRHCIEDGTSEELQISDGFPTSQELSPYIPGECLIATSLGSVLLWSLDRSEEVIKGREHRFYCSDQWRQSVYGGHPRQIIYADNSVVESYDMRRKTHNWVDLFALPSKFLDQYERIRIIKQHSPFLCLIGTDYSLFAVDERFPGHPLLQWQHTLKNPPQYLNVMNDLGEEHLSLILIGSQNPMEALCYLMHGGNIKPLQGLGSPWMLSRVHDFTLWDDVCHGSERVVVDNRYNKDSLLGLCCMPYKDGFVTYQLDSHCDIFYQVYHHTDKGDKSFTSGPGMNSLQLDAYSIEKGRDWVQAINTDVDDNKALDDPFRFALTYDASTHFEEIILTKPSHVLCALCNGEDESYPINPEDQETLCHCCLQNLKTGATIATKAKEDKVCSIYSSELKDLPLVSELPTDVLSEMITRLWNDQSVDDLLNARDDEVKKKLERIKEVKKKHAASKQSLGITSELPSSLQEMLSGSTKTFNLQSIEVDNECSQSESGNYQGQSREIMQGINISLATENDDEQEEETSDSLSVDKCLSENHTPNKTKKQQIDSCTGGIQQLAKTPDNVELLETSSDSRRRRHSSISSISSLGSVKSDSLPGFMRTPNRKFLSPRPHTVRNNASESDTFEEELFSPESRQSFHMFSKQKTFPQSSISQDCGSPVKQSLVSADMNDCSKSPQRKRQTQLFSSPKKVKLKKTYVSGF